MRGEDLKKTWRKWTTHEDRLLKKLVDDGKNSTQISTILGRTKGSIQHRKHVLGLCNHQRLWTADNDAELTDLVGEGKTSETISKQIGRTKIAVEKRRNLLRIPPVVKISQNNPPHLAELIKFRLLGWTVARIAEVFGVTEAYISQIMVKNGFKRFGCIRKKHTNYQLWDEVETALLRKYLESGYSHERIQQELPHRSITSIKRKAYHITRFLENETLLYLYKRDTYGMVTEIITYENNKPVPMVRAITWDGK